jgi:hypothetical protein
LGTAFAEAPIKGRPAIQKPLRCASCPKGGEKQQHSDGTVFCATAYEMTGNFWLPVAIARSCEGSEHLQQRLMTAVATG